MRLFAFPLICAAFSQVPSSRIVNAAKEPENWLTYSGNYQGHRHSMLKQLTTANVSGLRVTWAYQLPFGHAEVSPVVLDGIMYLSGPNWAAALDAASGRPLWKWDRAIPSDYHSIGFGR